MCHLLAHPMVEIPEALRGYGLEKPGNKTVAGVGLGWDSATVRLLRGLVRVEARGRQVGEPQA